MSTEPVIALHGSVILTDGDYVPDNDSLYRETIEKALKKGYDSLANGSSAIDAVEETVIILEESGLFNAGRGSVFTADGKNELDASIMDGKTGSAGSVAAVRTIKNPIRAARTVMESSWHVMMIEDGAEQFAREQDLEMVEPDYFFNEGRWEDHKRLTQSKGVKGDVSFNPKKHGTVGCVARDRNGNLAAGTSTGGLEMKLYGRVGDSPIIGAGTYAENNVCAVSCTGQGEYFMRNVIAYDVAARIKYKQVSLQQSISEVVSEKLKKDSVNGGIIGVDEKGNVVIEYNSPGMFRGYMNPDSTHVAIFDK